MRNFIERRRASEKGFTLIELLVVIVILGILAAVVVFAVGGLNDKGEESACKIDTRTLRTAEEAYFAKGGSPGDYATEDELVTEQLLSEESSLHQITGPVAGATDDDAFDVTVETTGDCGTAGHEVGQHVEGDDADGDGTTDDHSDL